MDPIRNEVPYANSTWKTRGPHEAHAFQVFKPGKMTEGLQPVHAGTSFLQHCLCDPQQLSEHEVQTWRF